MEGDNSHVCKPGKELVYVQLQFSFWRHLTIGFDVIEDVLLTKYMFVLAHY